MKIAWLIGTSISASDFESVDAVNNSGGWNNTQLRDLANSEQVSELIIISVRPEDNNTFEASGKVKIYHLQYSPVTKRINNELINSIWAILEKENPDLIDIQ